MSLETEIPNILIQSFVTVASVLVIGWRVKDSLEKKLENFKDELCDKITKLQVEVKTHLGISEPQTKELYGKINDLDSRIDKLIVNNSLKV